MTPAGGLCLVRPKLDFASVEPRVRAFLDEVVAWASDREDIRAVVLLGSQARAASPADEHSDVDVVLFADDPDPYFSDGDWLSRFGGRRLSCGGAAAVGGVPGGPGAVRRRPRGRLRGAAAGGCAGNPRRHRAGLCARVRGPLPRRPRGDAAAGSDSAAAASDPGR